MPCLIHKIQEYHYREGVCLLCKLCYSHWLEGESASDDNEEEGNLSRNLIADDVMSGTGVDYVVVDVGLENEKDEK